MGNSTKTMGQTGRQLRGQNSSSVCQGSIQEEDILYFKTSCMHICKYVCVYVCMIFETSFHYITLIEVDFKLSILLLFSPKC